MNFNILGVFFSEKLIIYFIFFFFWGGGGYEDFVDILLRSSQNWTIFSGHCYAFKGIFLRSRYRNCETSETSSEEEKLSLCVGSF